MLMPVGIHAVGSPNGTGHPQPLPMGQAPGLQLPTLTGHARANMRCACIHACSLTAPDPWWPATATFWFNVCPLQILDEPVPASCNAIEHADFDGYAVQWGLGNKARSGAQPDAGCPGRVAWVVMTLCWHGAEKLPRRAMSACICTTPSAPHLPSNVLADRHKCKLQGTWPAPQVRRACSCMHTSHA